MIKRWSGVALSFLPMLWAVSAGADTARGDLRMEPKVMEQGVGVFRSDAVPVLQVGAGLSKAGDDAVAPVREWMTRAWKTAVWPEAAGRKPGAGPTILVGLLKDHPDLRRLADVLKPRLKNEGLGPEGYVLEITPGRILLGGEKPAGVFYGALKLAEIAGESREVPAARIADWPAMRWRGMHVMVNGQGDLPVIEKLINQLLPERRLNALILEVNYNFRYRSHPEIAAESGLTQNDCRGLAVLAKRHNIRLIPMINCLGHQSWAKDTARLLKAHPEFDETPDLPPDNPGIYCRSWCPSHPDVNRLIFDLFDELLDAFQADAFHVGMDEVFILGECPRCKGTPTADLFAKAVNDYHRHLVGKRKVQMMLWGDRLLDSTTIPYGKWEASANGTAPAIERIPKDIVVCDWHYEGPPDFPSVEYLQAKGFPVWPAGWNNEKNAAALAGVGLRHAGERMLGYLATTWTGAGGIAAGLSGDPKALEEKTVAGVVAAVNRTSRLAWEGERGLPAR